MHRALALVVSLLAACGPRPAAPPGAARVETPATPAPPVPAPPVPAPAPLVPSNATSFRYDEARDAWTPSAVGDVGLYFVVHGHEARFEHVGTLCQDLMRAEPPPPGRVTTCVPGVGRASVRDVPDPTPLTALTCDACVVPTCTTDHAACRPVLARVVDPRGTLAGATRAAVERRWRALLLTLAAGEVPTADPGCTTSGTLAVPADPAWLVARAARWDLGGLYVDDALHASIGPLSPAMTGVRLERGAGGAVRFCGLDPGE